MRIVSKLLVAATAAAAITAMVASPALADPPTGVTPKPKDVIGVGSDTTESVFNQLSVDYNKTHTTGKLYSFDATPQPSTIQTKSGSTNCSIPRPFGSSAGIMALDPNGRGMLQLVLPLLVWMVLGCGVASKL